jgi:maleylacetoacetate isomerase
MDGALVLHGYWRSTAAWRVRLALAWKGLDFTNVPVNLLANAQLAPEHVARQPQGLVPSLAVGDDVLIQSLAIIEYLEERWPDPPLLPADPVQRANARAAALVIAADMHPLANLRVQRHLATCGLEAEAVQAWARHWVTAGLDALAALADRHGGAFMVGDSLSMADICLVPQLYNARRVGLDVADWPALAAIESRVAAMPFSLEARPEKQPDAAPPAG